MDIAWKTNGNRSIEEFNRTYRKMFLIPIYSLEDVREITDEFVEDYNQDKPDELLAGWSPVNYRKNKNKNRNRNLLF